MWLEGEKLLEDPKWYNGVCQYSVCGVGCVYVGSLSIPLEKEGTERREDQCLVVLWPFSLS